MADDGCIGYLVQAPDRPGESNTDCSWSLWVRNSGAAELGGLGSGSLRRTLAGAASSEGSSRAGGAPPKMAHVHPCWKEASVPRIQSFPQDSLRICSKQVLQDGENQGEV